MPTLTTGSAVDDLTVKREHLSTCWNFPLTLYENGIKKLRRIQIREIQVNLGKLCNQACNHCHVDAGPNRTEIMSWQTMEKNHPLVCRKIDWTHWMLLAEHLN